MKKIYFLFFIIFASCSLTKKTYICGDNACIDKKEYKDFFAKNLIIEVEIDKQKKKSSIDLVKLNTKEIDGNKKKEVFEKSEYRLSEKEKRALLKERKYKLKQERKIKVIQDKKKSKEEKKLVKLKKNKKEKKLLNTSVETKVDKPVIKKKIIKSVKKLPAEKNIALKKNETFISVKSQNQTSVCEKIKNCDIDKISELLIKKGQEKDFPSINSK